MAHPSLPLALLPLANDALVRALGCTEAPDSAATTAAYSMYVSLVAGIACSACNAAQLCASRELGGEGGKAGSNARTALKHLHAESERLRQAVETAYDAASEAGDSVKDSDAAAALWARHKALSWELADAEARLGELSTTLAADDDSGGGALAALVELGASAVGAADLALLLRQRALLLSRLLLSGAGDVPGAAVQRNAVRVMNAVAEGMLSSAIRAVDASTLPPALIAAHPLLACLFAPALDEQPAHADSECDDESGDMSFTPCLALQCVALYALAQPEGYTAREIASAFAPAMLRLALSPAFEASLRATAAGACADLVSVLGAQVACPPPAPGLGGTALAAEGLWQRFAASLSPSAILGLSVPALHGDLGACCSTFAPTPDPTPLRVQLPVARLLIRAALSGMVASAPTPLIAPKTPGEGVGDLVSRWPLAALVAKLHSIYYALLWRAAASDIDALASPRDFVDDVASSSDIEAAALWGGVSSDDVAETLHVLAQVRGALNARGDDRPHSLCPSAQGLSALAALSPLRKAAVVAGSVTSLRGIMAVARRRCAGAEAAAATAPASAPTGGRSSARVASAPKPQPGVAAAADEDAEAGAGSDGGITSGSDSDVGENAVSARGSLRIKGGTKAVPRSAAKAKPLGARSVVSAAASSVGGDAFGEEESGALLSSAAGWFSNAVQHVISLASGEVLPRAAGSSAAEDAALVQAWALLCPALFLTQQQSGPQLHSEDAPLNDTATPMELHPACIAVSSAACHVALALELSAAAVADIGGLRLAPAGSAQISAAAAAKKKATVTYVGGLLLPVLLPALLSLAPQQLAPASCSAAAALAASLAALQKGVVTVLRSSSHERSVRKIHERWVAAGTVANPAAVKTVEQFVTRLASEFALVGL